VPTSTGLPIESYEIPPTPGAHPEGVPGPPTPAGDPGTTKFEGAPAPPPEWSGWLMMMVLYPHDGVGVKIHPFPFGTTGLGNIDPPPGAHPEGTGLPPGGHIPLPFELLRDPRLLDILCSTPLPLPSTYLCVVFVTCACAVGGPPP